MAETLFVKKFNETYLKVSASDNGLLYELNEFFRFSVENAKYTPRYKAGVWDGTISLYNLQNKTLYGGLYDDLVEFCNSRGYSLELEDSPAYGLPGQETGILYDDVMTFFNELNIHSDGKKLDSRDYQIQAIQVCLNKMRQTMISPTGSGKSLIIYVIIRYILEALDGRVLLIVPSTSLVHQMKRDFIDYSSENGFNVEDNTHAIMSGVEKKTDKAIVISTWQSLTKQTPYFFNQFDAVLCDETQHAKAAEISKIIERCTDVKYRIGLTGTLDNSKVNKLVIKGLFGPITKVTNTKKLIDQGTLSDLKIKMIVLNYSAETKRLVKKFDYQAEVDFICQHTRRNKFITNLALSLEGNTLILYNFIEKHGDRLHELLLSKIGDRKLFYVHGGVDAEDRDEIRGIVDGAFIHLDFGDFTLELFEEEDIPLIDGTIKKAKDITENDDVDTSKCINSIQESTLLGLIKWNK